MVAEPDDMGGGDRGAVALPELPVISEAEHLLRVAASVAKDASNTWADMWAQLRPHVTPGGAISDELQRGFVPACGWAEFLEKYWLLKHYLDSIDRICRRKH